MDYGSQVALIEKVGEGGGQKCIDHLTGQVTVLSRDFEPVKADGDWEANRPFRITNSENDLLIMLQPSVSAEPSPPLVLTI